MAHAADVCSISRLDDPRPSTQRHVVVCPRIAAAGRPQRHWRANEGRVRLSPCPASSSHHSAVLAAAAPATAAVSEAEDRWVHQALQAMALSEVQPQLGSVHSSCMAALSTLRMPTTKNEDYRFTDLSAILQSAVAPPTPPSPQALAAAVAAHGMKQAVAATVVVVDGVVRPELGSTAALPAGCYIGGLAGAPADVTSFALGAQSRGRGGPFATLNGGTASDAVVIHLPANTVIPSPIHILYLSSAAAAGGARAASAPRLLALLEEGAVAEIVEEFAGVDAAAGTYFCNAVAEVELDDGASLKHCYVVLEAPGAAHMKATLVNQGKESSYALTEARLGGGLTRHDVGVDQLGPKTATAMRSFLLSGASQLHDLHSKLSLNHPEGEAAQLHKCIAAHPSSRAVFDGNVRVNRLAQRTDAQQLSRNLLLAPRATVNVKPNLQIVADDVKCTHGCTVSDLAEEELFYLRARGIDPTTARQMLVYSFGREVVAGLRDEALVGRVEAAARAALAPVLPGEGA